MNIRTVVIILLMFACNSREERKKVELIYYKAFHGTSFIAKESQNIKLFFYKGVENNKEKVEFENDTLGASISFSLTPALFKETEMFTYDLNNKGIIKEKGKMYFLGRQCDYYIKMSKNPTNKDSAFTLWIKSRKDRMIFSIYGLNSKFPQNRIRDYKRLKKTAFFKEIQTLVSITDSCKTQAHIFKEEDELNQEN